MYSVAGTSLCTCITTRAPTGQGLFPPAFVADGASVHNRKAPSHASDHLCVKRGARFSIHAAMPSWGSSNANELQNSLVSSIRPSSKGISNEALTTSLAIASIGADSFTSSCINHL